MSDLSKFNEGEEARRERRECEEGAIGVRSVIFVGWERARGKMGGRCGEGRGELGRGEILLLEFLSLGVLAICCWSVEVEVGLIERGGKGLVVNIFSDCGW